MINRTQIGAVLLLTSLPACTVLTEPTIQPPNQAETNASIQHATDTFEKKLEALGCKIEGASLKEKHVFACMEKIQGMDEDELKALNQSLTTGHSAESEIKRRLDEAIRTISTIVRSPEIKNKATRINQIFLMYREGDKAKGIEPVGKLVTRLIRAGNRLKLTQYVVAILQVKHQLAVKQWEKDKKGLKPQDIPLSAKIDKATSIVDILAMEGCLRGFALPNFRERRSNGNGKHGILLPSGTPIKFSKSLVSWLAGEYACENNRYIKWSELGNELSDFGLKDLTWFPNQKVVLLDNQADFDLREALISGDYTLLPQKFKHFLQENNLRRYEHPYSWVWMWGFYDDEVGMKYARFLSEKPEVTVLSDGKILKKNQDIQVIVDMNMLDADHHRDAGKILVPHSETSRIFRNFTFESDVVIGRKYDKKHFGYGMHKKGIVIDGRYFIMGGRNFGIDYTDHWRDTDVFIAGNAAQAAAEQFYHEAEMLDREGGMAEEIFWQESKINNAPFFRSLDGYGNVDSVALVTHEPAVSQTDRNAPSADKIFSVYLDMLSKAKSGSTVYIENAYIILTPPLRKAIAEAVHRGVNFQIYTNSPVSIDEPIASMPIMLSMRELLELNKSENEGSYGTVSVRLRRARYDEGKKPSTLHSKYMLVETNEGPMVLVGTYNLHPRGLRYEEEMAVVIKSPSTDTGAYKAFLDWFKKVDLLVKDKKINSGLPDTVDLTNPDDIALLLPADDNWIDPRVLPEGGVPKDGLFAFINGGVAAAMIIGFEQL